MKNLIIKNAVLGSVATVIYITLVATFLSHAQQIFGKDEPKGPFIPIAMLSLLVFSVALVGSLIFGRPIFWYLEGKKKEAITLLAYTLAVFFLFTIAAFSVVYFTSLK